MTAVGEDKLTLDLNVMVINQPPPKMKMLQGLMQHYLMVTGAASWQMRLLYVFYFLLLFHNIITILLSDY
jgi:hypothetical protein